MTFFNPPLLVQAAKNPPDLRKLLTPARIASFQREAVGLKLSYATERVNEEILDALFDLANDRQVLAQMKAMQTGERVNMIHGCESENRPALHTAMRDVFEQGKRPPVAQAAIDLAKKEIEKLKTFLPEVEKFTDIVQIGIGGSSLGPEAIYLGLEAYAVDGRRAHFISNVDPDETTKVLSRLDLSKTLIIVVSKSGSTLETVTNEALARDHLKEAGLSPKDHLIAVTGKGSPMDDAAKYRATFYIWDYIGGRYSVTSMVGGVLLAFAFGIETYLEFLKGAHEMDKAALKDQNLPLLGALLGIWNRNFLNLPTVAVIPYSQALARFPAHLQQLDMESNGKHINKEGKVVDYKTGPIIWGEPGTNGQHSFFQSIHQGTTIVPLEIIGFKKTQYGKDLLVQGSFSQEKLLANLFAQAIALAQGQDNPNPNKVFTGNRPSSILFAEKLDPFTLGKILAYYEHKVVFQGFLWNINSFDQEGVQLGKKLATVMIKTFEEYREGKVPAYKLGEAYLKL
ncbi:MAG TPA: glucose-6-phosphate isomerase [Rhabdochlamydiaceae bacterium]|jgi:glucose-6-phosphate isomerase|nr:glucose-6-phosphate isomerase [Rhabdochlamydiaceae bacterium]